MKILHVGKFYSPVRGGIETVTQTLAEGMANLGDQVTVLSLSPNNQGAEEALNHVRVIRAPAWVTLFSQPLSLRFFSDVRKLAPQFDLIHLHCPHPLAEIAVLTLPRELPVVVSYHADIVRQKLLLPFYRPLQKMLLSRAARILASSQILAASPVLAAHSEKMRIVPYGIHSNGFFENESTRNQIRFFNNQYGTYSLFIGRMVSYKGIEVLIEAATKIKSHVVIIGDGPLLPELRKMAERFGVHDRVHFLGAINDPIVFSAAIRASGALILPSISNAEAFGLVQIEAMSCGKPCIVSHLSSGASSVIEDGVSGNLVPPGNASALAHAIESLFSDPVRLSEMGKAALLRFERHYQAVQMIKRTREIYQECLSASDPIEYKKAG